MAEFDRMTAHDVWAIRPFIRSSIASVVLGVLDRMKLDKRIRGNCMDCCDLMWTEEIIKAYAEEINSSNYPHDRTRQ